MVEITKEEENEMYDILHSEEIETSWIGSGDYGGTGYELSEVIKAMKLYADLKLKQLQNSK